MNQSLWCTIEDPLQSNERKWEKDLSMTMVMVLYTLCLKGHTDTCIKQQQQRSNNNNNIKMWLWKKCVRVSVWADPFYFFFFGFSLLLLSLTLCFLYISFYYYLALVDDNVDDIDHGLFVLCSTFSFVWSSSFDYIFFASLSHFSLFFEFSSGSMLILVRSVRRWNAVVECCFLSLCEHVKRRFFCFLSTQHK